MRVKDEQLWSLQLVEFEADDLSRKFRDFLVSWADTADRLMAETTDVYQATGKSFDETEQEFGYLSVEWLSQMLLVLIQHWFHGDELWESLSVWERRMVEQATALKIAELQEQASGPEDLADVTDETP